LHVRSRSLPTLVYAYIYTCVCINQEFESQLKGEDAD